MVYTSSNYNSLSFSLHSAKGYLKYNCKEKENNNLIELKASVRDHSHDASLKKE